MIYGPTIQQYWIRTPAAEMNQINRDPSGLQLWEGHRFWEVRLVPKERVTFAVFSRWSGWCPDHLRENSLTANSVCCCLLVDCLTSQQHASVSQGRICTDNFTCCHTEIEVAYQTFHLTQSQYTDTGLTSPSTDPKTPGAWQGRHWGANV